MTKEEIVKKTQEFEIELSKLSERYGIDAYEFIGCFEVSPTAICPVCIHWVAPHTDACDKYPAIIKTCFSVAVSTLSLLSGQGFMYRESSNDTGKRTNP